MPTKKPATPPAETYTADQLPEVLRSKLVAGVVIAALNKAAEPSNGPVDDPIWAILTTTAEEIRDWHTPKPRPDHLNGEPRFGDPV